MPCSAQRSEENGMTGDYTDATEVEEMTHFMLALPNKSWWWWFNGAGDFVFAHFGTL